MSVIASSNFSVETAPSGVDSLWDISRLLLASWAHGVEVTNTWPTLIAAGNTAAEKRVSPTSKPLRTIRFMLESLEQTDTWLVRGMLQRMGVCRSLVPLYCDHSMLGAASSGAVLTCSTTNRRFFVGARVVIAATTIAGVAIQQFESAVIQSVSASTITLTAPPSVIYPIGSKVVPLLECDVWLSTDAVNEAAGLLDVEIVASEVPGASALPALAAPGAVGSTFGTAINGYPVFDIVGNPYVSWRATGDGWRRSGTSTKLGQGVISQLFGASPRLHSTRQIEITRRTEAWEILTFWDACRGSTTPFYAIQPFRLLTVISVVGSAIQVQAAGPLIDWQQYGYLAVIGYTAGVASTQVQSIQTITRAAGVDTISMRNAFTAVDRIVSVAPAQLMRFEGQDLVEKWTTGKDLALTFSLLEVQNEADNPIPNLTETYPAADVSPPPVIAYATGAESSGGGVDANWTLGGGSAYVCTTDIHWHDPQTGSSWISRGPNHQSSGVGVSYTYSTTVNVGASGSMVDLSIGCSVMADDVITGITVNGTSTGLTTADPGFSSPTFLSLPATLFVRGNNTVTFTVLDHGFSTGINVIWALPPGN